MVKMRLTRLLYFCIVFVFLFLSSHSKNAAPRTKIATIITASLVVCYFHFVNCSMFNACDLRSSNKQMNRRNKNKWRKINLSSCRWNYKLCLCFKIDTTRKRYLTANCEHWADTNLDSLFTQIKYYRMKKILFGFRLCFSFSVFIRLR